MNDCPVCDQGALVLAETEKLEEFEGGGIGLPGQGPPRRLRRYVPGQTTYAFSCGHRVTE